ncbi:MAG: hypothetical protein WCI21_02985 [Alphaproteobacteria bacterium]
MNADDVDILLRAGPDRSLEGLEGAVWRGVAAREVSERRFQALALGQAALGALAIAASAVLGGTLATQAMAEPSALGVFSPHMDLAPSSRLSGHEL